MALALENDILYLHIPKTGGNWMTDILRNQGLVRGSIGNKHATFDTLCDYRRRRSDGILQRARWSWQDARKAHCGLTPQPRVVCVVRHPLRWYESWFKYQTARNWQQWGTSGHLRDWHVMSDMNANAAPEFDAFMRNVNARTPGYVTQLFAKYAYGSGADVLHNETLADDLVDFCRRSGLAVDAQAILSAPRLGESPSARIEWDPATLRDTIDLERAAFRRYGYDPETSRPASPG